MGGRPEFKAEEVQVTVSEEVPVPGGLSDREAPLDSSLDYSLDTSLAVVPVDPEGMESTEGQITSDKTGGGGLTMMGVGSAAVVIESRGIGGHCESATATWDRRWPDKDGLRDQEVLASKICQASTICCITAAGAIIVYHHNTRDPLQRNEPLTV